MEPSAEAKFNIDVCAFLFDMTMTVKGFFKGIGRFCSYLFVPRGGSKRHREQQAYEERLDEAMERVQAEKQ